MQYVIYLAAPLFTHSEKIWNKLLAETIRKKYPKFKVILPQEEAIKAMEKRKINYEKLFNLCINGINSCDIVLAVLDGADSDSGTCFECGYAFAIGKKLIGVRTDIRKGEEKGLNVMLSRSCEIIKYISKKIDESAISKLSDKIIKKIKNI